MRLWYLLAALDGRYGERIRSHLIMRFLVGVLARLSPQDLCTEEGTGEEDDPDPTGKRTVQADR
jgi:hypothetical protein